MDPSWKVRICWVAYFKDMIVGQIFDNQSEFDGSFSQIYYKLLYSSLIWTFVLNNTHKTQHITKPFQINYCHARAMVWRDASIIASYLDNNTHTHTHTHTHIYIYIYIYIYILYIWECVWYKYAKDIWRKCFPSKNTCSHQYKMAFVTNYTFTKAWHIYKW